MIYISLTVKEIGDEEQVAVLQSQVSSFDAESWWRESQHFLGLICQNSRVLNQNSFPGIKKELLEGTCFAPSATRQGSLVHRNRHFSTNIASSSESSSLIISENTSYSSVTNKYEAKEEDEEEEKDRIFDASLISSGYQQPEQHSSSIPVGTKNPYEGLPYAWQFTESLTSFFSRLPPSRTIRSVNIPWIYICNPYHFSSPSTCSHEFISQLESPANAVKGCENEAPLPAVISIADPDRPESISSSVCVDLPRFLTGGNSRLEILSTFVTEVNASKLPMARKTREILSERDLCTKDLLNLAHVLGVRAGKWMLFPRIAEVDKIWRKVAAATAAGELGMAAKVAPNDLHEGGLSRLICIYTHDFRDRADVRRVLNKLREMGLAERAVGDNNSKTRSLIYYKPGMNPTTLATYPLFSYHDYSRSFSTKTHSHT